jgi:PAS domain S-box-containing protein
MQRPPVERLLSSGCVRPGPVAQLRNGFPRPVEFRNVTNLERFRNEPLEVALVANTDHAVIVADQDGVICFWNPAAERIFGHSRSEAVGETLDIIIPGKLRARHWAGYRRVMETGQTDYAGRTLAVPAERRDGSRISVEFTVTLLRDMNGAIQGVGAILRDVSAKWEEQRSLHKRVGELERELAALRVAPGN